jgi:hypothetical protein
MHQEKEHETAVNKNVHDPSEEVLSQYSELKQDIEKKYFHQGEDFGTEDRRENSLDGRKNPCGG